MEAQGTGSHPTGRGFHVLVVEDDQDAAESLCALLRIWGYECEACNDAIAGLRAAWDHRPDCLLIDIDMPGSVGFTLARKVRMQPGFDRVKLVALTFHAEEAHVRRS